MKPSNRLEFVVFEPSFGGGVGARAQSPPNATEGGEGAKAELSETSI